MKTAISLIDTIHLAAALTTLGPWLGLALASLSTDYMARLAWVSLGVLPMVSSSIAVLVVDIHLIKYHPLLKNHKLGWFLFLITLPVITGPFLWVVRGRPFLKEQAKIATQVRPPKAVKIPVDGRWSNKTFYQEPRIEEEETARIVTRVALRDVSQLKSCYPPSP
jgi:hypothetical protein